MSKTSNIIIRVSQSQKENIVNAAKAENTTISNYILNKCFEDTFDSISNNTSIDDRALAVNYILKYKDYLNCDTGIPTFNKKIEDKISLIDEIIAEILTLKKGPDKTLKQIISITRN